jgi:hypothetical protein
MDFRAMEVAYQPAYLFFNKVITTTHLIRDSAA